MTIHSRELPEPTVTSFRGCSDCRFTSYEDGRNPGIYLCEAHSATLPISRRES